MSANEHDVLMVDWMAKAVYTLIRGVIACFPHVRLEKLLILLAAVMGQQLATMTTGDELAVFRMRKMCRDAFCDAMSKEAVATPKQPDEPAAASIGKQ